MSFRCNVSIGRFVGILGLVGAIYGLERVDKAVVVGSGIILAMAILLISVFVGVIGFVVARYSKARATQERTSERLVVETLAKVGPKMYEESRNTKNHSRDV